MHGHKESRKDLNLKILTSEWDSIPRPHEYQYDALTIELPGGLMSRASDFLGIHIFIKFNQLYLHVGTGCVCFFLGKGRGGDPICTDSRRVINI